MVNGESIYGTKASPFAKQSWGTTTTKTLDNGDTQLFVHAWSICPGTALYLSNTNANVIESYVLESKRPVKTEKVEDGFWIHLPEQLKNFSLPVIALTLRSAGCACYQLFRKTLMLMFPFSIKNMILFLLFVSLLNQHIQAVPPAEQKQTATSRLAKVMEHARRQEPVTVVFFGGSITWGATATDPLRTSWRALVMKHFRTQFPQTPLIFIDAAIGGQPSRLGVFRIDRDVIAYAPDLVFVEFTINDGTLEMADQTYEGIIRKIRHRLPKTAIVPVIVGAGRKEYVSPSRVKHIAVAKHYGLPVIDLVADIRQRIQAGLKLSGILTDGVHPNDTGYALYAQIIIRELDRLVEGHVDISADMPAALTANRYETASMLELSKLDLPEGWQDATPSVVGTWFDHTPSRWFDSVVQPTQSDATLPIPLKHLGKITGLGLYFERLPKGTPLVLEVNDNAYLAVDSSNQFNFARVNYLFEFLSSDVSSVVLRATKGGPAAVAYLLYTTEQTLSTVKTQAP